jgi:hypothetical protein
MFQMCLVKNINELNIYIYIFTQYLTMRQID